MPPGLNTDDTAFASSPAWADCDNARFRLGRPQTKGGWESLVSDTVGGVCRWAFAWTDNANTLTLAFGTHLTLNLYQGGALFNITPLLALPAVTLGASPIAVTNGSPTIVVSQAPHPYIVGDSIVISGATALATVTINGTWTVTAITAGTWTFTAASNANATTTGGGSAVVVTPQRAFTGGQIDGTGSTGYGTGAYGGGAYGAPSVTDYFPLTWSGGAYGQTLVASPRNQTIFQWNNVTGTPAAAIVGAPANVTYCLVAPTRQVFALGCNEEVSGTFNPLCIRHSGVAAITNWTTLSSSASTAREYVLPGGGRIVAGRLADRYMLVWTNHGLWLGTYVGQITQVWRFDKVGDKCGLIGPQAAVVLGSTAYWPSPDRQFHSYALGGSVQPIACPIREDFADHLAASQGDKIVGSSVAEFGEVRFDYPDSRDGYENSRYVSLCVEGPDAGSWHRGIMARTAMVDAGPSSYPCGVTYAGQPYWHEKGGSADGGALSGFIETSDIYLDPNLVFLTRSFWPDIAGQVGPISLTVTASFYPQGPATTYGPYTLAPGDDKADFKAKARLFKFRYAWNSAPSEARFGIPLIDGKACGRK